MRQLIAALPIVMLATQAHAVPAPPQLDAPHPLGPTPLELDSSTIAIDCDADGRYALDCTVTATYAIANPTDQPVTTAISLPYREPGGLTLDGQAADAPDDGLELTARPGATRRLGITHKVRLEPYRMNMLAAFEPLVVRHPLLGQYSSTGYVQPLRLPVAREDERSWARVGDATYVARYPSSWEPMPDWTHTDEPGQRVATLRGPATRGVSFHPSKPDKPWKLIPGGPYVELGGTFDVGVRARVGYELGLRAWLLTTVSVGTDFDEDLIITPLVEAASPNILIIPSLGVGLGAPIRVRPDTAVGVRIQLVAAFPLGFVTTFDYWPGDDVWRTTLSARIGI